MSEVNPNYNPLSDWKQRNNFINEWLDENQDPKIEAKVKADMELGQFLNWFIRHYDTATTKDGLMYYANAEGKEVSIAEILEHYKNKEK